MHAFLNQPVWIYIAIAIVASCAGCALVFRAQFMRIGRHPHCKRCNYELRGVPNEKCPECGKVHGKSGPPRGRRRRRRWALAAAALLWALGAVALAPVCAPYLPSNVYVNLPLPIVLFAAERGEEGAMAALEARAGSGAADPHASDIAQLVTRQIDRLWVDTDAQAPDEVLRWAGVFEAMYPRGVFSSAEIEAFFDVAIQYTLTLPEARSDYIFQTEVVARSGLPENFSRAWAYRMESYPLSVAGVPYPGSDRPKRVPRLGAHPSFPNGTFESTYGAAHNGFVLVDMGVSFGEHEAEVGAQQAVYDVSGASPVLIYNTMRTLTGRVSFVDGSLLPTVEEVRRMEREAAERANLFFDIEIAREFYRRNAVSVTPGTVTRQPGKQTDRRFPIAYRSRFRPAGTDEWIEAQDAMGTSVQTYPSWLRHSQVTQVYRDQLAMVSGIQRPGVGTVVDLELLPEPTLAGPGADEQALGFGVRYEGITVLAQDPPDSELFPAPQRVLLLDHTGNVLEELPIDGDIWAVPPADDEPASGEE